MLTKTHPKHPDEPGQKQRPEPGHLFDPAQRDQTEIKTNDASGEMQHRGSGQRGVNCLCRRQKLPAPPGQRQNDQPARRGNAAADEGCAGDRQTGQHPVAPPDRPGVEDPLPETVRRFDELVQYNRIAKFEQRQTEPCAREAGKHFWPDAFL